MFTTVGIATVVMQTGGIRLLLDWIASKKRILMVSLYLCVASLLLLAAQHTIGGFIGVLFVYTVIGSPHIPLLSALLTERTRQEDQGGILGLMQSVTAFGQILGPLMAGIISQLHVAYIFVVAACMFLGSALLSHRLKPAGEKIDL
jgi:MFS family permease